MKARLNAMEMVGALMVVSVLLTALCAPLLAPYDPTRAVAPTFGDPGWPSHAFPLGTDQLGRDILSRIIFGARISLTVGVADEKLASGVMLTGPEPTLTNRCIATSWLEGSGVSG